MASKECSTTPPADYVAGELPAIRELWPGEQPTEPTDDTPDDMAA